MMGLTGAFGAEGLTQACAGTQLVNAMYNIT